MRDQIIQKLQQCDVEFQQLEDGVLPEYLQALSELEMVQKQKLMQIENSQSLSIKSIHTLFESEKISAEQTLLAGMRQGRLDLLSEIHSKKLVMYQEKNMKRLGQTLAGNAHPWRGEVYMNYKRKRAELADAQNSKHGLAENPGLLPEWARHAIRHYKLTEQFNILPPKFVSPLSDHEKMEDLRCIRLLTQETEHGAISSKTLNGLAKRMGQTLS